MEMLALSSARLGCLGSAGRAKWTSCKHLTPSLIENQDDWADL